MHKAKWLSEEALQIAEKRREAKGKGEKERYIHLDAESQRIARRDKKVFVYYIIFSASVRSIPFLSFIVPIFAGNVPLVFLIF